MKTLDVFTFGETMVLFQPEQMMSLEYVHHFPKRIGGAESNVAIGLTRLGSIWALHSEICPRGRCRYLFLPLYREGADWTNI